MARCDFVVKYNPEKDSQDELSKRILNSIIIKRLKAKKPVVWFIGGDSGEGKSWTVLRVQEILFEIMGLDINEYLDVINVHTPIEYPEKLDKLLFDKEYKKVNIIAMHEAREVVKAKMWQNFLTQSVADVNALSRSIKRLCIMIVSQFIRDVTSDIRYTLNFYSTIRRPKNKRARLYFNVMWKDDRDLEKPKLRKRKLSGYLVYPDGKTRRFVPQYFEISRPSKEIIERFEKADYESKAKIIRKKINRLIKEMKSDMNEDNDKLEAMVDWYAKNQDSIHLIGKRIRNRWKLKPEAKRIHDLDVFESREFERLLNEKLSTIGVMDKKEEELG